MSAQAKRKCFILVTIAVLVLLFAVDIAVFRASPDATISTWMQVYVGGSDASLFALLFALAGGVRMNMWGRWGGGGSYALKAWACAIACFVSLLYILVDLGVYVVRDGDCSSSRIFGEAAGVARSTIAGLGLGVLLHHWFASGGAARDARRLG